MLEFIVSNFECKTLGIMLYLYNSLVRPYLGYAVRVWSLNYKEIKLLERVQRGASKIIPSLTTQHYEKLLKRFKLFGKNRYY